MNIEKNSIHDGVLHIVRICTLELLLLNEIIMHVIAMHTRVHFSLNTAKKVIITKNKIKTDRK